MPRRALYEKRPFLLASIAAALAFHYLRAGPTPELYLVPLKGSAMALLAIETALYALALGAMAAGAWASAFPRYRVGAGAMLFVMSDILLFAEMGPLGGTQWPRILAWPIYYLGQFLICTGVIQTLRKRKPELRLVSTR